MPDGGSRRRSLPSTKCDDVAVRGIFSWAHRALFFVAATVSACQPENGTDVPEPSGTPKSLQDQVIASAAEVAKYGFPIDLNKFLMEVREPDGMIEVADGYVAITRRRTSHDVFAHVRRALEIPPVTNGEGMRAGIVQMIAASTMVGFQHDRDTIVFRTDAAELGGALEHALVRALVLAYVDHNMGGLAASVLDASSATDTALVRQCLTEGFADFVADTVHSTSRFKGDEIPSKGPASLLGTHGNRPCAPGTAYVAARHADGGWQSVLVAFGAPPTSSEQLLHPKKLDKDFPVHVALPPWPAVTGEADEIQQDVVGELAIERILRERGYDDATATRAAIGWDGDRLGLWRVPSGEFVMVWRTVWDREEDAEQFAGAIAPFTSNEPRAFRIITRGRIVDAVSSESEAIAQAWYTTLQESLDQLAIEPSDTVSTREVEAEPPPRPR